MREGSLRKLIALGSLALALPLAAQELSVPQSVVAGNPVTISVSGGSLIVVGPGTAMKKSVSGGEVTLAPQEVRYAGDYTAISGDTAKHFTVTPAAVAKLNFDAPFV